jgi:hypothetical protein
MPGARDEGAGCDTGRPLCGQPARFYPAGWRCDEHRPHRYATTNHPQQQTEATT